MRKFPRRLEEPMLGAHAKRHPKVPFQGVLKAPASIFDEGFFALVLHRRQQHDDQHEYRGSQQAG